MFKSKHSLGDFIEGVIVGSSLGTVAAFVLGNAKGKKLQKGLHKKYKMLGRKVEGLRDSLKKASKAPAARKFKKFAKNVVKTAVRAKVQKKIKHKIGSKRRAHIRDKAA